MNLNLTVLLPSKLDEMQRTLFNQIPAVHRNDPITSYIAEDKITESGKRESHAKQVYEGLKRHPDVTNAELAAIIGLTYMQVERRLYDLKRLSRIVCTGNRKCTVNGTQCSTWRINNGTYNR